MALIEEIGNYIDKDNKEDVKEYRDLLIECMTSDEIGLKDGDKVILTKELKGCIINKEVGEEILVMFLQEEGGMPEDIEPEKLEPKINMYYDILKINAKLHETVDFRMFDEKFLDLGLKMIVRITAYPELQENMINLSQNEISWQMVQYIMGNSDNWIMEIDQLSKNMGKISQLIDNLPEESVKNLDILKNLTNIVMGSENYFNIKDLEGVENFTEIKKEKCLAILNGQDVEGMSEKFYNMEEKEWLRFAMLELTYGIDLEQATNIVKKYGKDIKELTKAMERQKEEELTNEEKDDLRCVELLINLKVMLEEDIELVFQEHKEEISNWEQYKREGFDVSTVAMEAKCIHMYERLYDKEMYKLKPEEKKENETYVDTTGKEYTVEVYEINSDFNMFVRSEGAYSDWKEPDDFLEDVNRPNIEYHGNCKSYIGQNSLALARPEGPIYGYTTCKENGLLLAAPWDIISSDANNKFATSNVKWDFENGVEYRIPNKEIDTTRHGHNEVVSDRIKINEEGKFEKDKPNCVIWLEEGEEDHSRWKMTKKAAAQLGVPIVIIDREKFAQRETEKIEQMKKVFLGETENKDGLKDEILLERMIVEFENNRTGMKFATKINDKYFTEHQRQELMNAIKSRIEEIKQQDPKRYKKYVNAMCKTLEAEIGKGETNKGVLFRDVDTKFYEEELKEFEEKRKEIEKEVEMMAKNNSVSTSKNTFEKMEKMDELGCYEPNELHSIEHVEKVMLFSEVLAKKVGLSKVDTDVLLAAAAFHDSGREGRDGNGDHAEPSAKLAGEYLEGNKLAEFGIQAKDVPVVQVAIHYHEHRERECGKLDILKIQELCENYGVEKEDFERTQKICALLKDADALDRTRFEKRGVLDPVYLRSEAAMDESMIKYAQIINREIAKQALIQFYGKEKEELKGKNPVALLREERILAKKEDGNYKEPHLPSEKLFEIYRKAPLPEKITEAIETSKKKRKLVGIYKKSGIETSEVRRIQEQVKDEILGKEEQKSIGAQEQARNGRGSCLRIEGNYDTKVK